MYNNAPIEGKIREAVHNAFKVLTVHPIDTIWEYLIKNSKTENQLLLFYKQQKERE